MSRDEASSGGRREEEPLEQGFECVKPYSKRSVKTRDRLESCVPAEGGVFDNIRTAMCGRFTDRSVLKFAIKIRVNRTRVCRTMYICLSGQMEVKFVDWQM